MTVAVEKMRTDPKSINAYSQAHRDEFRDDLRDEAVAALTSWPARVAAGLMVYTSFMSWVSVDANEGDSSGLILLAYIPALTVLFGYPLASLLFSRLAYYSREIVDLVLLLVLLGFVVTLALVFEAGSNAGGEWGIFMALSGQINFTLMLCTAMSFHSRFVTTCRRNIMFTALMALLLLIVNPEYLMINITQIFQGLAGGLIIGFLFYRLAQTRFYYRQVDADARLHLYDQLSKLVYPHQLDMVKSGEQLEQTMPTKSHEAIVSSFDVQRSTDIAHPGADAFFAEVFSQFTELGFEGYAHNPLRSRTYRIKENGDGYICSTGYPFLIPDQSAVPEDYALDTALKMMEIFRAKAEAFDYDKPINACISLAHNVIRGTFQNGRIRSYDLYGPSIVQADRYEEMRKSPVVEAAMTEKAKQMELSHYSMVIVQQRVYNNLSPSNQALFSEVTFGDEAPALHHDREASAVYFLLLP